MNKKQVYCRYCGRLIDEDAPFCTYCGKPQGDVRQDLPSIKRKAKQYMDFLVSVILSILGLLCLPLKKLVNIRFSEVQKDKFRRAKKLFLRYSIIIIAICAVIGGGIARYSYYYDKYLPNALDYYNRQFELGFLSSKEHDEFIKAHGLQNMSIPAQERYYKNYQFERYFNGFNNYKQLRGLDKKKRDELLEGAILNKTLESFYKGKASDDDFIRMSQLTPEGKRELIKSDYDPSDKYYYNNPLATIATGAAMGAGVGTWFGGIGAVPGAIAGATYGGIASIGDALVSSLYNNNTESKLNDIVARDNDRKKRKSSRNSTPSI